LSMRKLLFFSLIISVALFFSTRNASAFDMCDQNCSQCHTLTAKDAEEALGKLIPDVKVLEVGKSPINGLWEIGMEARGRKGIIYLDFSKKKIIAGNIIDLASRKNYTQESFQKINPPKKVDFASIPLKNSIVMGNKDAKHKVIVFIDPA
jgi:thiol:disulfide interchange protein DsbC